MSIIKENKLPEKHISDSTTSSNPKPKFQLGELVAGRWQIMRQLGSGGCGVVHRVMKVNNDDGKLTKNLENNQNSNSATLLNGFTAALKAESIDPNSSHWNETLSIEAVILRRLQWSKHACRLFMAGRVSPYINAIVMSEVGPSLSRLRRRCPQQRFTLSTALRVSIQCINAIEDLHSIGFIHRDIKPSNFAIGRDYDTRKIFLLDFGFSRAYLEWEGDRLVHRRQRPRARFLGTERYCSPNVHKRVEQGRRDDLWSMFFTIVELMRGKLPWRSAKNSSRISLFKTQYLSILLERCPAELREFAAHVSDLDYASAPDYNFLRNCLEKLCRQRNFNCDDPYDWEEGGRFYKRHFKNFFHEQ